MKIHPAGHVRGAARGPDAHQWRIQHSDWKRQMKKFIKVMKALSDPTRVRIMKLLQRRTLCVCELQEALGIAQSTTSKHLKILEEAGLITFTKEGLWVNYTVADGSDSPYAANILGNLKHWLDDDPEIRTLVEKLPGINRESIIRREKAGK